MRERPLKVREPKPWQDRGFPSLGVPSPFTLVPAKRWTADLLSLQLCPVRSCLIPTANLRRSEGQAQGGALVFQHLTATPLCSREQGTGSEHCSLAVGSG